MTIKYIRILKMKITQFFKTQEEMLRYYNNDVKNIPSSVLAIVGEEDEDKVLYTNTNNQSVSGEMNTEGGYVDSPETLAELSYATSKSEEILVGNTNSTIEVVN